MKFHAIALAALAVASGAQATPINLNAASTVKVYMSGASASRNVIFGIVYNDVCGGATNASLSTYNVTTPGPTPGFTNWWGVSCKTTAAFGSFPAGTDLAFFKTDAGGSATGVFPIVFDTPRNFVNPAACTTVVGQVNTGCATDTAAFVPMIGTSDLEPKMFQGINVPNDPKDPDVISGLFPVAGLDDTQLGALTIKPIFQTVFGIAVNPALYNAMFTAQGLGSVVKSVTGTAPNQTATLCTTADFNEPKCVPSIGYAQARSYFAGNESNWRLLVGAADTKLNTQVNVCRRAQGSGTQATANLVLMGFPCNSSPLSVADYNASSAIVPLPSGPQGIDLISGTVANVGDTQPSPAKWSANDFSIYLLDNVTAAAGQTFIFEGAGTGDVTHCLSRAEVAGGYAIGHVSKENAPNTTTANQPDAATRVNIANKAVYRHVKLEGTFPHRDTLKAGNYDYAVESTVQFKTDRVTGTSDLSANQKAFITSFSDALATVAPLAYLPTAVQNGIAALPTAYAGAYGSGTTAEILFGSRVSRGGNSCTPFSAFK
jgi:hypothetical protein